MVCSIILKESNFSSQKYFPSLYSPFRTHISLFEWNSICFNTTKTDFIYTIGSVITKLSLHSKRTIISTNNTQPAFCKIIWFLAQNTALCYEEVSLLQQHIHWIVTTKITVWNINTQILKSPFHPQNGLDEIRYIRFMKS